MLKLCGDGTKHQGKSALYSEGQNLLAPFCYNRLVFSVAAYSRSQRSLDVATNEKNLVT